MVPLDQRARPIAPGFTITPADAEKLAKDLAATAAPPAAPATATPAAVPRP